MSKLCVTTASGAVYIVDEATKLVTGGSKHLKAGGLMSGIHIGLSMRIHTPERVQMRGWAPTRGHVPVVLSTPVISIEAIPDD